LILAVSWLFDADSWYPDADFCLLEAEKLAAPCSFRHDSKPILVRPSAIFHELCLKSVKSHTILIVLWAFGQLWIQK
jgi:hypothetical protein